MESKLATLLRSLEVTLVATGGQYVPDREWPHYAWRVTIKRGDRSYATDYKCGTAHSRPGPYNHGRVGVPPTVADVMACLMSDARVGSQTFDEYCSDFGLDNDSRKALDTHLACQRVLTGMRTLLGEHFDAVAEAAAEY